MKTFFRFFSSLFLLCASYQAFTQCNNPPDIIGASGAHSNITTSGATLGAFVLSDGGGACSISTMGVEWSTTAGGPYTSVPFTGTLAEGAFSVDVSGLTPGTLYYYRAYVTNPDGDDRTNEKSFYTLSTEPSAHAASITATTISNNEIYLQFPAASAISNADGYVILIETGSNPNTNNLDDGAIPDGASDFLYLLNSDAATDYTVTGLTANTTYYFTIVPYNREGNDGTYNYLTTAGYPFANATTEAEVDVNAISGGLAPTGTPLVSSSTDQAVVGFQLNATGSVTFQDVVIHLSSTTSGKLTNFRLSESSDGTFDGVATDPLLTTGVTISPTATEITITLSEIISDSPNRNFFLIADVAPVVDSSTPSVQFSYAETDFTFDPANLSGTGSQSRTYTFSDATPPSLVSITPADNSTGVNFNLNKLVLTFNENVDNIDASAGNDPTEQVIIYDDATDLAVTTVDRLDVNGTGTTTVEVDITGVLQPNSDYYVMIGNAVIEDPSANAWTGIGTQTAWNFSTSGVTVNNLTSEICSGSFQSIGDIVISEEAVGDFITSGAINLDFANADFGFDISSVTVSAGPAGNTDIASIQLNPKTLTRLTLNYTLDGSNDKVDVITISGLKVYASGPGSTTIVNGNSIAGIWAADAPVTFATINVGTSAPTSPVLESVPAQDLLFCHGEDISTASVAVVNDGGVFKWYNNASLSTLLTTGFQVDVADLGIDPAVVGTVKRYVVRVDGCQSAPLEVTFTVAPIPVADAGPANASLCSGSSITLGGAPTLVSPSVSGGYQYLWSTDSPAGFTDMGSNPVVSPTYHKDTTFTYTVKIIDANNCASDILDPNATIVVQVDSTDEEIVYKSPLNTTFTLNSDPIKLEAEPSINSAYSGNGVYASQGVYYFDPDLAGTAGSPHQVVYTTELTNGCVRSETRSFSVSNSSGSIVNLANSYCANELADPAKVLTLGSDWSNYLAQDNAYYAQFGYEYEFYDFQTYIGSNIPGTGVLGTAGNPQHLNPQTLQPYPSGSGEYAYVGMRVRRHVFQKTGLFGIIITPESWDPPIFWMIQYVNIYKIPEVKFSGVRQSEVVCDVSAPIELEGNFNSGSYAISRNGTDWVSGPTVGVVTSPINSGKGLFHPHDAYVSTGFAAPNNTPATGITNFYLQYTYEIPNTTSSTSGFCVSKTQVAFQISNNPSVAWLPFSQTEFCYEAADLNIQTNGRNTGEFDVITGYGVRDNNDGTAIFNPDEGLSAKAFGTNSPPYTNYNSAEDIVISAKRTDGNGCNTTITQTVKVHPLFPASFTEEDLNACHEDGPQNIVGAQPNGTFQLTHPDLTVNFNQNTITGFDLSTYFDQAVNSGADGTVMQSFQLTFNTIDPVLTCGNSVTKTFTVNPPLEMNIVGLTPGMITCGNGAPIPLEGNWKGAGSFEISDISPTTGFQPEAFGLDNTTSGNAVFTPSGAGLAPGSGQKSYHIRYSYMGPGCVVKAQITEELIINPQPAITFSGSIPAANTQYCFEQSASPTTISLTTNQTSDVVITGEGITDNGGGSAIFNPTSAYQQSSLADNENPLIDQTVRHIPIVATRTDALGCSNSTTTTYIVNPLPTATFSPAQNEFCYEDDPVVLSGAQTNVSYQFVYKNTTSPANYSPPVLFQSTANFDPPAFFDAAVARGANPLATLQFDVIYTAINSTTGCTNRMEPVTLNVSPVIPVTISGVESGEIFCSNTTDKVLEFSPPGGTFRINGALVDVGSGQYTFDPAIDGPAGGTDYVFTYELVTGNNCTNTLNKTVKVLPSPRALFDVEAQCEGELIPYHAESSTNLASSTYTWTFSGETKTGQDVEHRFPGISSYYAKLEVEHPPFAVNSTTTLVCSDSLQLDQIVGPYPENIEFTYFNICEGDNTNFEVSSNVPINRVSWDFGDGESTDFGILSESIPGLANTTGPFQAPVHKYTGAYDSLVVRVEGKTSDDFGGCPYAYERTISILKQWAPSAGDLHYDMSELDNGKGFWVVEDREGNATWKFNTAAKRVINTNELTWVTGPSEPYKANDISYVNSPCFDLSDFSRPVISIQHWTDTEPSDGAVLQYSVDGGFSWQRLGDVASGLDWYNRLTISSNPGDQDELSSGWSLNTQKDWAVGKHTLDMISPLEREKVRFRVAFASFNNREQRDGFAFNNVVIEERNRTILVENFTNEQAITNNNIFKNFKGTVFNPAELVKLQYHHASAVTDAQPDDLHLDNPVDQNARAAFYGVTSPVKAFIDGGFGQSSTGATFESEALDNYFSLRTLVTSPVNISIDFLPEYDASLPDMAQLYVKATVQATNDLGGPGRYNVFIAIAEQVVNNQVCVLRKFLPDASGTPLTSLSATDPAQEIKVSYDMRHVTRNPGGDFAPFAVIVFVQDLQSKDVLQTVMRQDGTASSEVVTGIETPYDNYVRIYPNPADDVLNIILPAPVKTETPVKLFDTFGREVYSGSFRSGDHVKALETKSLSSGVYLIQLSTPEGSVQKRAMIVHE